MIGHLVLLLALSAGGLTAPVQASGPCPDRCTCNPLNYLVNCSSLGLQQVPKELAMGNWKFVDLSFNHLSDTQFTWSSLPATLLELYLNNNNFITVPSPALGDRHLIVLEMKNNSIRRLSCSVLLNLQSLQKANLAHNKIESLLNCVNQSTTAAHLTDLNLSFNNLQKDLQKVFLLLRAAPSIKLLDLSGNRLSFLRLPVLDKLERLNLSSNRFVRVEWSTVSGSLSSLQELDLSNNSRLKFVDGLTLTRLFPSLRHLTAVNCQRLAEFPSLEWPTLTTLRLRGSRAWNCTCDLLWLMQQPSTVLGEEAVCAAPAHLLDTPVLQLNISGLGCSPARINRQSLKPTAYFALGDKALLQCPLLGNPEPRVTWTIPIGKKLYFHPSNRSKYLQLSDTVKHSFHHEHTWHASKQYDELPVDRRFFVLHDGSLFIDYVTRQEGGSFICTVFNGLGNDSAKIEFKLNYDVLRHVRWHSQLVGLVCAGSLLAIGVFVGIFRLIARRCRSKEKENKRKTVRELLEHIEAYKTEKMEQFRVYRSNKMDAISGKYTGQVQKLKEVCQANMDSMQEQYNKRLAKIRENCDRRMEKIRETYQSKMAPIKDYKSHKVERLRENYQAQIMKVRAYASNQLERLREQYHLQQQYLIKIMEAMNMENCMSGSETDALRDENLFTSRLDIGELAPLEPPSLDEIRSRSHRPGSPSSASVSDDFLTADEDEDDDDNDQDDGGDSWSGSDIFDTDEDEQGTEAEAVQKSLLEAVAAVTLVTRHDLDDNDEITRLPDDEETGETMEPPQFYDIHFRRELAPRIIPSTDVDVPGPSRVISRKKTVNPNVSL